MLLRRRPPGASHHPESVTNKTTIHDAVQQSYHVYLTAPHEHRFVPLRLKLSTAVFLLSFSPSAGVHPWTQFSVRINCRFVPDGYRVQDRLFPGLSPSSVILVVCLITCPDSRGVSRAAQARRAGTNSFATRSPDAHRAARGTARGPFS